MTTLHLHHLVGCAPAPLARYLKALGILRLVAEQKDPAVRGWWPGRRAHRSQGARYSLAAL